MIKVNIKKLNLFIKTFFLERILIFNISIFPNYKVKRNNKIKI